MASGIAPPTKKTERQPDIGITTRKKKSHQERRPR